MRQRILAGLLALAAVAAVVVAIGVRVRAHRLSDPAAALAPLLPFVPADVSERVRIIERGPPPTALPLQVEIAAGQGWMQEFLDRNGFARQGPGVIGLAASRWSRQGSGSVAVLLWPDDGSPALLTIVATVRPPH